MLKRLTALLMLMALALPGCANEPGVLAQEPTETPQRLPKISASQAPPEVKGRTRLAIASSIGDENFARRLVRAFSAEKSIECDFLGLDPMEAFEKAREGAVDVVLSNQPKLADDFAAAGYGYASEIFTRRFALCGPESGFENAGSVTEAFAWIGESSLAFLSYPGDALQVENSIWQTLQIKPEELLNRVALGESSEALGEIAKRDAYALVDWNDWLEWIGTGVRLACGKGDELHCRCQVVWLNPEKAEGQFLEEGRMFAEWLQGITAKALIKDSGVYEAS
jgi:ABC-type tungstate transport system permease subunit